MIDIYQCCWRGLLLRETRLARRPEGDSAAVWEWAEFCGQDCFPDSSFGFFRLMRHLTRPPELWSKAVLLFRKDATPATVALAVLFDRMTIDIAIGGNAK